MRKYATLLLSVCLLSVVAYGCGPSPAEKTKSAPPKKTPSAHAISRIEEKKLMKNMRETVEAIENINTDAEPLKKVLTGKALEEMTAQVADDLKQGRRKVRSFKDPKLAIENYTKGIAGLSLKFNDFSYYVDLSGKSLTKPTGIATVKVLAAKKKDGRWKVYAFFEPYPKK